MCEFREGKEVSYTFAVSSVNAIDIDRISVDCTIENPVLLVQNLKTKQSMMVVHKSLMNKLYKLVWPSPSFLNTRKISNPFCIAIPHKMKDTQEILNFFRKIKKAPWPNKEEGIKIKVNSVNL